MNTRFRLALVAFAVIVVVAAGAFVFAQGAPPPQKPARGQMMGQGPGGWGGPGGPMMLGRLNLTDEQRAQVQKLMEERRQAHQPDQQKMAAAQKALRDAIFADAGPDESAIQAAQAQIQALHPVMAQHRLEMEAALAKILTPEQRKQMREMPAGGPGGRGGRGRGMMMRHGGF